MIKGLQLRLKDYRLPPTLVSLSSYERLEHAVLTNYYVSFLSERVVSCFLVKVGAETTYCEQRHLGHIQC